jgi:hypothetical protein
VVVHRPGPGAIVAVAGLMLFMLSLLGLPWISEGGEDATLSDIGDSLEAADDLAPRARAATSSRGISCRSTPSGSACTSWPR